MIENASGEVKRVTGEKQVFLYDTTLRDGSQRAGISFSLQDKLRIAHALDAFGIHFIEAGWPGANPKDNHFFEAARREEWIQAELVAFGSTRRVGCKVQEDPILEALLKSGTRTITIFGKSWDLHVTQALGTTLDENCRMIEESVAWLKEHGIRVIYDAEHFFDGFKHNPEYAIRTLHAAANGGADWITLCDTNGGSLPEQIGATIDAVRAEIHVPLGIHTHDDAGLGVANSLIAVRHGATMVQGTVNGYGERCGNANLCAVIPNLVLKMDVPCLDREKLKQLHKLSYLVSETANLQPLDAQPYVGKNAFAHKGGVHVSAILKNPTTYEHVLPEEVGNERQVLISELSGKSNLIRRASELGWDLEGEPHLAASVIQKVKELENQGYHFESAEGSLYLLLEKSRSNYRPPFLLSNFQVSVESKLDTGSVQEKAHAYVELMVGSETIRGESEGDGPVNALDRALRKGLLSIFPELSHVNLLDYKVRVIEGSEGTGAKVRVLIESGDGQETWSTIGVSSNILSASCQALIDSLEYYLVRHHRTQSASTPVSRGVVSR